MTDALEATASCDICGIAEQPDELVADENDTRACYDCQVACDGPHSFTVWAVDQDNSGSWCQDCLDERVVCDGCNRTLWQDDAYRGGYGSYYCESCFESICPECGDIGVTEYREVCENCSYSYEMDEEYQEDFDYEVESFEVREFAQIRGPMMVSYELEFTREPEPLARALYRAGLSDSSEMESYSSGTTGVKYDGSVDGGGELVGSQFWLPKQSETNRFWRTFEVLRNAVKNGDNGLDMRCGLHIHVDAQNLTLPSVMSMAVAFNYLEDILYRLSAANWRGHRSNGGNDYAKVSPKDITSKERFRHSFGDRYLGLNLGNYLSQRFSCNCGAEFDRADHCTCTKRKMTIEFRLFNTTANHIKMHAYTALVCALVAFGKDKELVAADLPPFEYTHSPVSAAYEDKYRLRLRWMFEVLPLSAEERDSIRYCIKNSDLAPYLDAVADDNDLRIPVFIPIRQDEAVPSEPRPVFVPPPIDENTRRNDYGEYVYLRPGIETPCSSSAGRNGICRSCWRQYPQSMVDEWNIRRRELERRRDLALTDDLVEDEDIEFVLGPAPEDPGMFATIGEVCDCGTCRESRALNAGWYIDVDGRWHRPGGQFASHPASVGEFSAEAERMRRAIDSATALYQNAVAGAAVDIDF